MVFMWSLYSHAHGARKRLLPRIFFAERHELTEGMCVKETEEFSVACHQFALELAFAQFLRYKRQNEAIANDMNNRFVCM